YRRKGFGDDPAHLGQRLDIDAGIPAHRLEQKGGVFEHDVAGRAGCVGAAAEPAERGVELAAAGVEGGEHVGGAEPAGVVEMRGDRERRDIADDSAEYALD